MVFKLEPTLGVNGVPFGAALDSIVAVFGAPNATESLTGSSGARDILEFAFGELLISAKAGLVAATIEISSAKTKVELWGEGINRISPDKFVCLLGVNECEYQIHGPDRWGDVEFFSMNCGLIASFCEQKLESVEVHSPLWRETEI